MRWMVIAFLGALLLILTLYDYWTHRQKGLRSPHIMLLLAALVCFGASVLQPGTMKFGNMVELRDLAERSYALAEQANSRAQLAEEINAMGIWNEGRFVDKKEQERLATEVLRQVYGDKADEVRYFLQHHGLFRTPATELASVPKIHLSDEDLPELYKLKWGFFTHETADAK